MLLVCTVFISLLGIVTVYSATIHGVATTRTARANHSYLIKQTLFVVIGFGAMIVDGQHRLPQVPRLGRARSTRSWCCSWRWWSRRSGSNANGAQSWYELGGFQLQPSEISKVLLIIDARRPARRLEG